MLNKILDYKEFIYKNKEELVHEYIRRFNDLDCTLDKFIDDSYEDHVKDTLGMNRKLGFEEFCLKRIGSLYNFIDDGESIEYIIDLAREKYTTYLKSFE